MAFPQGINFRAVLGYVTDGTNYHFDAGGGNTYPDTTAQGNTVGWETGYSGGNERDRDNAIDVRLAGIHFVNVAVATYRIDLPSAGDYIINFALGDTTGMTNLKLELFDDVTSLGSVTGDNSSGGTAGWFDASGTPHVNAVISVASASFAAVNPSTGGGVGSVTKTFASTICRFKLGDASNVSGVAFFHIKSAGGTNTTISPGNDDLVVSLSVPTRAVNTYMSPDADVTDGNWVNESGSNTNLFASIDEFTPSDSDYIRSGMNPSSDQCEIGLSNSASTPAEPFVVSYRYQKSGTGQIDLVVDLVETSTIIKTWTHTNISTSFVTQDQTLSSGEFASITNFNNLRLRFTANKV